MREEINRKKIEEIDVKQEKVKEIKLKKAESIDKIRKDKQLQ